MLKQMLGIGVVCMVSGLTALPVVAGEFEDRGDRIEHRLDARGDRIEQRLDTRGARINERLNQRADRAAANGHPLRAAHLDERGNRIDNHLNQRGDRINNRLDRRGQAIDARFDRRHERS